MLVLSPYQELERQNFVTDPNILSARRVLYIHNLAPIIDAEDDGTLFAEYVQAQVTQVNKVYISGSLPDFKKGYAPELSNVRSFIKGIYTYSVVYKKGLDISQAISEASLNPKYGIITGFKEDPSFLETVGYSDYDIALFDFEDKLSMNFIDKIDFDTIINRSDTLVGSPLEYVPTQIHASDLKTRIELKGILPKICRSYKGKELIDSNTIVKYLPASIQKPSLEFSSGESVALMASDTVKDVLDKKIELGNIHVDLFKTSVRSLSDEFILLFDSTMGGNVNKFTLPASQMNTTRVVESVKKLFEEFVRLGERLSGKFGPVRLMYYSNDYENVLKAIFKNSPTNKLVSRLNKAECVERFMFDVYASPKAMASVFTDMYDLKREHVLATRHLD